MNAYKEMGMPNFEEKRDIPDFVPGASLDLRGFFRFLQRRYRIILVAWCLVAAAVVAHGMLQTPKYSASAMVMITPEQDKILRPEQQTMDQSPDSGLVDSQIVLLQSRKFAGELVDRLKLTDDPVWNPPPKASFNLMALVAPAPETKQSPELDRAQARQLVINRVAEATTARRVGLTSVIEIVATSEKKDQPAKMANALADIYFESQFQAKVAATQKASGWLAQRLSDLKNDLQTKEAAVETYRAQNGLLTAEGSSLTEQQVTNSQAAVMTAKADLAEKEARYRQVMDILKSGGSADSIASAINSDTMRDLRARETDLIRNQAEIEAKYGRLHPAVEKGRREIAGVEVQIRAEVARLSENIKNEAEVARARLAALQSNEATIQGTMVANNEGMIRLRELERDAAATRTLYENFLNRFQQLSVEGSLDTTSARLVAEATPPLAPSSPNLIVTLAIALALGAFLGIALGLAFDLLDEGLDSPETAERWTAKRNLALIPLVKPGALNLLRPDMRNLPGFMVENTMSAFAEGFRSLRTSLFYAGFDRQSKITAVTSAMPDEGKTTVAMCLARMCAMAGQRVIIIDCDLRRRSINALAGLRPKKGVLHVLQNEAAWEDVLANERETGLFILPATQSAKMPEDIFGHRAMDDLLNALKTRFDQIILDCPPVLAVAEARVIARAADQVVLVAKHGKTPGRIARLAVERLSESGAVVAGIVLNCVNSRVKSAGMSEIDYQHRYSKYYTA